MMFGALVVLERGQQMGVVVDGQRVHPDAMGLEGTDDLEAMIERAITRFTIRESRAPTNVQPQRKKNVLAVVCW